MLFILWVLKSAYECDIMLLQILINGDIIMGIFEYLRKKHNKSNEMELATKPVQTVEDQKHKEELAKHLFNINVDMTVDD